MLGELAEGGVGGCGGVGLDVLAQPCSTNPLPSAMSASSLVCLGNIITLFSRRDYLSSGSIAFTLSFAAPIKRCNFKLALCQRSSGYPSSDAL